PGATHSFPGTDLDVNFPRGWPGIVVTLLFAATAARADVVRGTLHVPTLAPDQAAPERYPGRASSMPGMHATPRGLVTDALISVDRVPAAADSALAKLDTPRPRLAQKDQAFLPRVVAVAVGGEVDFPNLDPIYHNVFSLSPVRKFDLGKYPQGHSKTVNFP